MSQPTFILGAGIIGVATAHHLSLLHPTKTHNIHLIEASPTLFPSASGHAAGFLARDWFNPALAPLAALSFDLHTQLAAEQGGREKWGWTRSKGCSFVEEGYDDGKGERKERPEDWLREGVSRAEAAALGGGAEGREQERAETGEPPGWLKRAEGQKVAVLSTGATSANVYALARPNPRTTLGPTT